MVSAGVKVALYFLVEDSVEWSPLLYFLTSLCSPEMRLQEVVTGKIR